MAASPNPPLRTEEHANIRYSVAHALYTPHPLMFALAIFAFIWVVQMILLAHGDTADQSPLAAVLRDYGWPAYMPFILWWAVLTAYLEALFLPFRRIKRFASLFGGGAWIANAVMLLYAEELTHPMMWYSIAFAIVSFWAYLRVGRVQDVSGDDYELILKERRRRERRYAEAHSARGGNRTNNNAPPDSNETPDTEHQRSVPTEGR